MNNDAMLKRAKELVVDYFTFTRGGKWSMIKQFQCTVGQFFQFHAFSPSKKHRVNGAFRNHTISEK